LPRKSPVRHHVKDHNRSRSNVRNYNRGKGRLSVTEIKAKEGTIDEHKRKLKKIGDSISYLDNGRRVSGTVVGIRAEYYLVERNGKIWRVDRHSVFTRLGSALGGAGAKLLSAGKVGLKATVEKAKALDGERVKGALKKGASGVKKLGIAGASKIGAEMERRRDERANWKAWKKEMEKEEKKVLEREKQKIKNQENRKKFREKIRKGPLWKRALKASGSALISEVQKKKKVKRKPKRKVKKKTKKAKTKKDKKITITVS
jgi:hypothetical protein